MPISIQLDDLTGAAIQALLQLHLDDMYLHSPAESVHALDLVALRQAKLSVWTAWDGTELLGCGALKDLGDSTGEIKSMRTVSAHLGRGVGAALLRHIEAEARGRGYRQLLLETGNVASFDAARRLYEKSGFEYCGPFGDYGLDPFSVFMVKRLSS
jgi:putative acetyltransferase